MINIEIVCLNYNIAKKVSESVTKTLIAKGKDAVLYDPYGSLFARVIRLVRTHASLDISKQAKLVLDAAREWDSRYKLYKNMENKENKMVVSPASIAVDAIYTISTARVDMRRVFTKVMLKKLLVPADYIIYVNLPKDVINKFRMSKQWKRRVESNMKGDAVVNRIRLYPEVLQKINKMYKSKCCIVDIEDPDDILSINKRVIEFIEENPMENA